MGLTRVHLGQDHVVAVLPPGKCCVFTLMLFLSALAFVFFLVVMVLLVDDSLRLIPAVVATAVLMVQVKIKKWICLKTRYK